MTTTFSAVGVATPAGWYDTDSTRLSRRRSQLEPRESKERMLRLNEDGEVDFRGSWRDTWHQRGLLVLNFAFLILGFALLFVGIYAIRTNPVGTLETLTSMQFSWTEDTHPIKSHGPCAYSAHSFVNSFVRSTQISCRRRSSRPSRRSAFLSCSSRCWAAGARITRSSGS